MIELWPRMATLLEAAKSYRHLHMGPLWGIKL
jgi:hypothetical protein